MAKRPHTLFTSRVGVLVAPDLPAILKVALTLAVLLSLCGLSVKQTEAASPLAQLEFFENRIRPVLAEHCYKCHSAQSEKLKGGLRVDTREALLRGGHTGPALVPGQPDASLLYVAISHKDPDLTMPPRKSKLPDSVLHDFRVWIEAGAAWPADHAPARPVTTGFDLQARKERWPWIWQTPQRQVLPSVQRRDWPLVEADYFVLAALEKAGLSPAPPAAPNVWLRRVFFALTGLPPTRQDLREFLAEPSPEARERVVDRLLNSPHYGDRWARHWMDLMRYAESRGHESDFIIANAWHYRDYLIRAFNKDVSYDQFVVEHVTGDLVARPRLNPVTGANESVLATGWAFLGEEVHSPVDIRKDETDRIDNKVDVFSKTFLGLTVACARCHDHKFDAIRSRDYYALSGFMLSSHFRQVRFESMVQNQEVAEELWRLRASARTRIAAAMARSLEPGIGEAAKYLDALHVVYQSPETNRSHALAHEARRRDLNNDLLLRWSEVLEQATTQPDDLMHAIARRVIATEEAQDTDSKPRQRTNGASTAKASLPSSAIVIADYTQPHHQPWKVDGYTFGNRPRHLGEVCLGEDPEHPISGIMTYGAARRDAFWNGLRLAKDNQRDSGSLAAVDRSGKMVVTPTVRLKSGRLHYLIRGPALVYAAVDSHIMITGPLHGQLVRKFEGKSADRLRWVTHDLTPYKGERAHIELAPVGDNPLEVLMVVDSPETPTWLPACGPWTPREPSPSWAAWRTSFVTDLTKACEALGQNRLGTDSNNTMLVRLADWLVRNADLFAPPSQLNGTATAQRDGLSSRSTRPTASLTKLREETENYLRAVQALKERVRWESHTAVSWFDGTGLDEHVLLRGNPRTPGQLAPRALPEAFSYARPIRVTHGSGRLELARQLVDPANPLVARVIVNRVWHHLFGRGLVPTVDNFGYLGQRPSHPELLDHLAWKFVHEDRWSLKRLIRRLVLSRTFGMSSRLGPAEVEAKDPANVLLHRMPVRRLEAEAVRDSLLAVAGRLDPTLYGPPVPVHLTEFVVGRGRPAQSGPLDGAGRRSIYIAVRRNFLPTMMLAFDMPRPFTTVGCRDVTNVPGQALVLMNDPFVHQQAERWAQTLLEQTAKQTFEQRVVRLFESAFARQPSEEELDVCRRTWTRLLQLHHTDDPEHPEAWADLCHALLNANEFIYLR